MLSLQKTYLSAILALLFSSMSANCQEFIPIENNRTRSIQKSINHPQANFHSSIQPYNISEVNAVISIDSINSLANNFRKLYANNSTARKSSISIYPLLSASGGWGKDSVNNTIYDSRLGAMVSATIASKFNLVGYYQGGVGKYARYIQEYSNLYKVVPGFGYAHQNSSNLHYRNWGTPILLPFIPI